MSISCPTLVVPRARAAWLAGAALLLAAACGDAAAPAATDGEPALEPRADGPFAAVDLELPSLSCGRREALTILEVNGGGLALFDGDDDGDLELLLVDPGPWVEDRGPRGGLHLLRNDGGWRFSDVPGGALADVGGSCHGVAVGDVDSDGARDLYVTRLGPNVLLRNAGGLSFEALDQAAGAADGWSTSACFLDLDLDGDLDLYVVDYLLFDPADPPMHGQQGRVCQWKGQTVMCGPQGLTAQPDHYWRNDDGAFVDATAEAGFAVAPGYGLGVLEGDFDEDGWPDVYVSNDSTPNHLFMNRGDGTVQERGLASGSALSGRGREQAGMGIAAADVESDGDEDLLVTNFSMEPNALYLNSGDGRFDDRADPAGIGGPSRRLLGWGVAFVDADLDGALDVLAANGHVYPQADAPGTDTSYAQPDVLLLGDGQGRFSATPWAGERPAVSRALATGDLDDDGVTDVVVLRREGPPAVWRGTAQGPSLRVVLRGPPGNPDAVGARVRWEDARGARRVQVRTSGGYQASVDPRPTFAWRGAGRLQVRWPDGRTSLREVGEPGRVELEAPR